MFFGMVGPVGSNLGAVCRALSKELNDAGYETLEIKVSDLIRVLFSHEEIPREEDKRINKLMDLGNELRKKTERGDILALVSVGKITELREQKTKDSKEPARKTAYILNQLKRPDEVRALRAIYGKLFFLIAAYLPKEKRVENLSKSISRSYTKPAGNEKHIEAAKYLVSRDEKEEGEDFGQDVSRAFPEADLFISTESEAVITEGIIRFIDILFSNPFHTPTQEEMGMYFARSAALRSADLSRQVGAAIVTSEGDVVSIGCNEVPKARGGQYWPSDKKDDRRDFKEGHDSSATSKAEILSELINAVQPLGIFRDGLDAEAITKTLTEGHGKNILKGTQIQNLLEFGRPVHAEMAAITTAARLGLSIRNTTLYSTTFPCHMCARHIISSGITRVVYVEPYPKSRVMELYKDSVEVDVAKADPNKLNFQPFVGVSPSRYLEFFEMGALKRKEDSGLVIKWERKRSNPRVQRLVLTYMWLEDKIIKFLGALLKEKGLRG